MKCSEELRKKLLPYKNTSASIPPPITSELIATMYTEGARPMTRLKICDLKTRSALSHRAGRKHAKTKVVLNATAQTVFFVWL